LVTVITGHLNPYHCARQSFDLRRKILSILRRFKELQPKVSFWPFGPITSRSQRKSAIRPFVSDGRVRFGTGYVRIRSEQIVTFAKFGGRPTTAIHLTSCRCGAASPKRALVESGSFLRGEGRLCGPFLPLVKKQTARLS
jgi:hypothetical protein